MHVKASILARLAWAASLPAALLLCANSVRADVILLGDDQLDTIAAGSQVSGYSDALATARGSRTLTNTITYTSVRSTGTATGAASGGAAGAAAGTPGGVATVDVSIRYGFSDGDDTSRFQTDSGQGIVARIVAGMSANITVEHFR
jgi:hypothetical protein